MLTNCAVTVHASARPRRSNVCCYDHPLGRTRILALLAAVSISWPKALSAQELNGSIEAGPAETKRELFSDVVTTRARRPVLDASTFRSRSVAVRLEELPKGAHREDETVPFNLFPDANFEGLVDKMESRGPTNYTLTGTLLNEPDGSFVLVRSGDIVVAEVHAHTKGNFEVRSAGDGTHVVRQVNDAALEPCANGPLQASFRRPVLRQAEAVERDGPNVLDIMVVYTGQARAAAGGTAQMNATVQSFVAAANQTYANSQINTQLRLVYSGEVTYVESGYANTDLSRLTYLNDGYLEEVHTLRNQYGADVVSLLVNDFDYCGIGWMHHGPTRAFSVVDFGCGSGTFVHEIGHNMGCAHDRGNANSPGQFTYSYGHRFTGQSGSLWRTVMSYAPGQRIQHFSNPGVLYDGVPTGVPVNQANSAHNAQTVNLTSVAMAGYRAATDMTDCNGNFQPDDVDLQDGTSDDCNDNQVPDECDLATGASHDTNGNDVPDECDCDASACDDGIACTLDTCNPATGACVFVGGAIPFGDLNYNGGVDVDDVSCALAAFENRSACPAADVIPCGGGNNFMDVDDLTAILNAFNGNYFCTSSCP